MRDLEATGTDSPGPLLADKVAVISGGAGSIGEAAARLFAEHGAHVVIADIDEDRSRAAVESIRAGGGKAKSVVSDVRVQGDVDRLRDTVLAEHGRVDVLVNNAGHFVRQARGFLDEDPELVGRALPDKPATHLHDDPRLSSDRCWSGGPDRSSTCHRSRGSAVTRPESCTARSRRPSSSSPVRSGSSSANQGVRVNGIGPDVTDALQVPYEKSGAPRAVAPVAASGSRSAAWESVGTRPVSSCSSRPTCPPS